MHRWCVTPCRDNHCARNWGCDQGQSSRGFLLTDLFREAILPSIWQCFYFWIMILENTRCIHILLAGRKMLTQSSNQYAPSLLRQFACISVPVSCTSGLSDVSTSKTSSSQHIWMRSNDQCVNLNPGVLARDHQVCLLPWSWSWQRWDRNLYWWRRDWGVCSLGTICWTLHRPSPQHSTAIYSFHALNPTFSKTSVSSGFYMMEDPWRPLNAIRDLTLFKTSASSWDYGSSQMSPHLACLV